MHNKSLRRADPAGRLLQPPSIEAFDALWHAARPPLSVVDCQFLEIPLADLPKAFKHGPDTTWIDEGPMTATLDVSAPVHFRLRSGMLAELALKNSEAWTFKPGRPEGCTLAASPPPGPFIVLGKAPTDASDRYPLPYDVRGKTDH